MKKLSLLVILSLFLSGCDLFMAQPVPTPTTTVSPPITFAPLPTPTSTSTPTSTPTPTSIQTPPPTSGPISTETVTPSEQTVKPTESSNSEVVFADKLSTCLAYKTTFRHLLTGETLEKEILGVVNGKCGYIEQMPNGGKMECKYTESQRKAVAQYYKDVAAAGSFGTSLNSSESGGQQTTYTIDGKEVSNPLQEAMSNGTCVISGY